MPADLADSQKAVEEDRKTDHAPLVAATENEEVATLTATIETHFRQGDLVDGMKGDLTETETDSNEALSEWGEGAPEEPSRRTQEQIVVEEVISTVDEEVFVAVRQHGTRMPVE